MITNVTNVFVSNAKAAVLAAAPTVLSSNTASTQAGQFILMNCDEDVTTDKLYEVKDTNAGDINKTFARTHRTAFYVPTMCSVCDIFFLFNRVRHCLCSFLRHL